MSRKKNLSSAPKQNAPAPAPEKQNIAPSLQSIAYDELVEYAETTHEICRRLMRFGMVFFYSLPVLLLIFLNITGTDRSVMLLIWIFCMFILAAVLLFISFFDKKLKQRVDRVHLEMKGSVSVIPDSTLLMKQVNGEIDIRQDIRNRVLEKLEERK